jgi:SAM-dependent methyltransferase
MQNSADHSAEAWPASQSLICPQCRGPLRRQADSFVCDACVELYPRQNEVWQFLPRARKQVIDPFLRDYTKIRLAEGRGSEDPSFYRNLPACPSEHPTAWQWQIRRNTYRSLLRILGPRLRVLDLGAGTGWLSNRLAQLGHQPCAIDLSCDALDGLSAARHYQAAWPRVQAEFDCLPIPNESADMAIFNASLHYSTDYRRTLSEALRVLRPNGTLVILETPIYKKEASGQQMVAERHARFQKEYGTRSDSIPSQEFLTWDRLDALGRDLGIRWHTIHPWYGVRWALRPWKARLRGGREPSRFVILHARADARIRPT